MATRTWSSSSSTDMNNTANYSGSGSFATDDLVFDATSVVNAAATANIACNSITITSGYSGTWALTGYTATLAGGDFSDEGITGNHAYGNGITLNGSTAMYHTGTGGSAKSASSCVLTFNGTGGVTFDDDKQSTIKQVVLGEDVSLTVTSSQFSTANSTGSNVIFGDNSTFTTNATNYFAGSDGNYFFTIGSGVTLNGSGSWHCRVYSAATTKLPAITYTGTGYWALGAAANDRVSAINFDGAFNIGTCTLYMGAVTGATNVTTTIDTKNFAITCGQFYLGYTSGSTNRSLISLGSSAISCTSISGGGCTAAATIDLGSSATTCAGSYTANGSATYTVDTSAVTITNTSTITCNGKTPFHDLTINASGKTITLADALVTDGDLVLTAGTLNQAAKAITVGGNCSLYGAGTINGAWTIAGNFWVREGCTCNMTGATLTFANAASIWNTAPTTDEGGLIYKGPGSVIYASDKVTVVETNRINNPKAVATTFQDPGLF